jgi:ATP:corrinoid adenosyltransferase
MSYEFFKEKEVVKILKKKPVDHEVQMTGPNPN